MKVLVYSNRKIDNMIWDASTPEKELAAHLALFKELDGYWQCYGELEEEEEDFETGTGTKNLQEAWYRRQAKKEREWYKLAKEGDAEAAKALVTARSQAGAEYEYFELIETKDPLA